MHGRFKSYFHSASIIINLYSGSIPFHHYIKQYFSAHKKYGSTDRKRITQLCYNYFRLGTVLNDLPMDERIKLAMFLCNEAAEDWEILFEENWLEAWNGNIAERISFIKTVYPAFDVEHVFPYKNQLSEIIQATAFSCSHLIQPDLFLRIRPGKNKQVIQKLEEKGVDFTALDKTCLSLNNTTKADAILEINKEVIVQDYSSQQIARFLPLSTGNQQPPTKVWDCCAASGGKSILAYDLNNEIDLTVSDLRPSILQNLKQRFKEAGIKKYHSFIADLTKYSASGNHASTYDLIICDAPCSGSGTWSRTPEQLSFFNEEEIERYAALQKKIISNVIPALKKDGFFLYITCSVFKKENEDQVNFIQQQFQLELQKMELLKGYDKKADTMFAALFAHSR